MNCADYIQALQYPRSLEIHKNTSFSSLKEFRKILLFAEIQGLSHADLPSQFPGQLGIAGFQEDSEDEKTLRKDVLKLQRIKLRKEIEKLDLEIALLKQKQRP